MSLRSSFLAGAQRAGGFWLAQRLRPPGIPILCYHGFSLGDEHRFRPALFIRAEAFEQRLAWLKRNRYQVIPLGEAIERLDSGRLGKRELVITIDDGFYSVATTGWPLLKAYGYPATLYATTYYAQHANPIFRLAIQYFFWRSGRVATRFDDLAPVAQRGGEAMWPLINWAERDLSEEKRWRLAEQVAVRLEADAAELRTSRRLSLLTIPELQALAADGLDLELHTHRHNLPEEAAGIAREIADNRTALERAAPGPRRHFCYPSGIWKLEHWPVLDSLGIVSATTCAPGINRSDTPRLALRRFLDSEDLTQPDFEAELTGFKTLWRGLRGGG